MSDYSEGHTNGQGTALIVVGVASLCGATIETWLAWALVFYGIVLGLWPWPWRRDER